MASFPIPPLPRLLLFAFTALALQQPMFAAGQSGSWSQGIYIWDSKSLLDPQQSEGELHELRWAGMTELMIIGGAQIYAQTLPQARTLHLTRGHAQVDGDTRLPPIDADAFAEVAREDHQADERHALAYSFITLQRR